MDVFTKYLFLLLSITLFGCSEKQRNVSNTDSYEAICKPIVAVYPVWKHSKDELQSLPWDDFSHLAISSIYPLPNGELNSKEADVFIEDLVSIAHIKGKKVIVSVGGAGEGSRGFVEISKNDELVNKFVANLLSYVEQHKIDGIDIDWEYWTYQSVKGKGGNDPIESQQLVDIVKRIKAGSIKNTIITVDIMAGYWVGEQYLPELQEYADYVNLMAFDFTGAWPESAVGYHSDFETFTKAIEFLLDRGFNKNQILVGIPAYGIEFENSKNESIQHHSYRSIVDKLDGNSVALSKGKIDNIYFETQDSVERKYSYLRDKSLGGIFMFEITSDHKSIENSLLKPANLALNKNCKSIKSERI
jgi:chitinase